MQEITGQNMQYFYSASKNKRPEPREITFSDRAMKHPKQVVLSAMSSGYWFSLQT